MGDIGIPDCDAAYFSCLIGAIAKVADVDGNRCNGKITGLLREFEQQQLFF